MTREDADKILKLFSKISNSELKSLECVDVTTKVINAIAAQVPYQVEARSQYGDTVVKCPVCEKTIHDILLVNYCYCPYCGQRLDIKPDWRQG